MSHPLQKIYDQIPKIECQGHCGRDQHNTCCGPIGCTILEAALLEEYNGVITGWESIGLQTVKMNIEELFPLMICPHLSPSGRCNAYAVRPLVCRLWGVVETLKCPWGCKPERYLTDRESFAMFRAAEVISAAAGCNPHFPAP
jgi:Fe-S-cluster containining protein